jgi:hypothetical protein
MIFLHLIFDNVLYGPFVQSRVVALHVSGLAEGQRGRGFALLFRILEKIGILIPAERISPCSYTV